MSGSNDLRSTIKKLVSRTELSNTETLEAFEAILSGRVPDSNIAAFLVALAMKGETAYELASIIQSLKNHAHKIAPRVSGSLIDTCGTGGDTRKSFNISTAAAIVASAAHANVAKHGNRSMTGLCGSADFFEYIGLDLNVPPRKVQLCIEQIGIGFLFAPVFHPSMKNVATVRKSIGIQTVFNKVGPLCNPCTNLQGQVIGVYEPQLMQIFSEACRGYLSEAMIVNASDGFDELSNTCENEVYWSSRSTDTLRKLRLHPDQVGLKVATPEQLIVNSKEDSVKLTIQSIYGEASEERQGIVILNAAAALLVAKIATNFREGVDLAKEAVKSGKAQDKLSQLIKYCGDLDKLKEAERKFLSAI